MKVKYYVCHAHFRSKIVLMDFAQLLLLGAAAGLTIFLGLPCAMIQSLSPKMKGLLNAIAIGILLFLTVDVFSNAWESTTSAARNAFLGTSPLVDAELALLAMFGGLAIGLLGLTWYGTRYMRSSFGHPSTTSTNTSGERDLENNATSHADAYKLSMMIAIGIGAHNFSEGLAIGQSYATGSLGLAVVLIIGFAAHNATEGFGIAAPLSGLSKRPNLRFLILTGIVGGGPTFVGTLLGSLWSSTFTYILFLSVAGGALVYVVMLMYNAGRRQVTNDILMIGFFVGLLAGFVTDLLVSMGGI